MLLAEGKRKGCLSRDQLFISQSLLYGSERSEESCGQAAERRLYKQQAGDKHTVQGLGCGSSSGSDQLSKLGHWEE